MMSSRARFTAQSIGRGRSAIAFRSSLESTTRRSSRSSRRASRPSAPPSEQFEARGGIRAELIGGLCWPRYEPIKAGEYVESRLAETYVQSTKGAEVSHAPEIGRLD